MLSLYWFHVRERAEGCLQQNFIPCDTPDVVLLSMDGKLEPTVAAHVACDGVNSLVLMLPIIT
jgi:hypothetical protein